MTMMEASKMTYLPSGYPASISFLAGQCNGDSKADCKIALQRPQGKMTNPWICKLHICEGQFHAGSTKDALHGPHLPYLWIWEYSCVWFRSPKHHYAWLTEYSVLYSPPLWCTKKSTNKLLRAFNFTNLKLKNTGYWGCDVARGHIRPYAIGFISCSMC